MPGLKRRDFLRGIAVASLATPLPAVVGASASAQEPQRIRHEASSPEGRQMLLTYREAVKRMKARPHHDPHSWRFQANIHGVPPDEDIDKIFDVNQTSDPAERDRILQHRTLALGTPSQRRVWATCTHGHPHFLTWHRMYMHNFERIVERIVGAPFALPYWDYLDASRRSLPETFREIVDGAQTNNALWFDERKAGMSDLTSPAALDRFDVAVSAPFGQRQLLETSDQLGFSGELEDTPHGAVHLAIGTPRGMGWPPLAARDPIFWLHHANLDRLWESWRLAPPPGAPPRDPIDPEWLGQEYAFVGPQSTRVVMSARGVLSTADLGYRYDRLEPMAPAPFAVAANQPGPFSAGAGQQMLARSDAAGAPAVTLGSREARVKLRATATPFSANRALTDPRTTVKLVLNNILVSEDPGVQFDVYVSPASGPEVTARGLRVGKLNLFGTGPHTLPGEHAHGAPSSRVRPLDITEFVRRRWIDLSTPGDFEVTIVPDRPRPEAPVVTIGEVMIIARP